MEPRSSPGRWQGMHVCSTLTRTPRVSPLPVPAGPQPLLLLVNWPSVTAVILEQKDFLPHCLLSPVTTGDAAQQRSAFLRAVLYTHSKFFELQAPKGSPSESTHCTNTATVKGPKGDGSHGMGVEGHSPSRPGRSARGRARRG